MFYLLEVPLRSLLALPKALWAPPRIESADQAAGMMPVSKRVWPTPRWPRIHHRSLKSPKPTPSMRSTPGQSGEQCPGVSSRWLPVLDGRQTISVVAAAVGIGRDGEWGELLGDTVIASAVLDRLLHHSHVLNIRGESYRLKEKRQAGLFPSQQLLSATPEEAGGNYVN